MYYVNKNVLFFGQSHKRAIRDSWNLKSNIFLKLRIDCEKNYYLKWPKPKHARPA